MTVGKESLISKLSAKGCVEFSRQNLNLNKTMTDQSIMPFGKFKGQRMSDIPASYLLWLWNNGVKDQPDKPVHDYIKDSLDALQQEAPDVIVDQPTGEA